MVVAMEGVQAGVVPAYLSKKQMAAFLELADELGMSRGQLAKGAIVEKLVVSGKLEERELVSVQIKQEDLRVNPHPNRKGAYLTEEDRVGNRARILKPEQLSALLEAGYSLEDIHLITSGQSEMPNLVSAKGDSNDSTEERVRVRRSPGQHTAGSAPADGRREGASGAARQPGRRRRLRRGGSGA